MEQRAQCRACSSIAESRHQSTESQLMSDAWVRKVNLNLTKKKRTYLKINQLGSFSVGITGLEPATSRPPDVCATNCAKSRSFFKGARMVQTECRKLVLCWGAAHLRRWFSRNRLQRYNEFLNLANFLRLFCIKDLKLMRNNWWFIKYFVHLHVIIIDVNEVRVVSEVKK